MIFGESSLKDVYRRIVWGPGIDVLRRLPSPWEHRIVRGMGRAAALVARQKRAEVENHLSHAFPEEAQVSSRAIHRVAADAFASHFANQYIGATFSRCTEHSWSKYIQWKGIERIDAHLQQGRGVVIAHPHMGPAQLPTHVLAIRGQRVVQVGGGRIMAVQLSPTGQWARDRRGQLEADMPVEIHDGRDYLRPLLRALDDGAIVMSAADGTGGGEELGRRLTRVVLDRPMAIPVGPVWLAYRSGAPLLTMHCYRNPDPGPLYVAEVGDELVLDRNRSLNPVLEEGADRLAMWLDSVLRAHPGDWLFWDGYAEGALLP